MDVSEIIAAFESQDDALPRQALEEAMARPAEVTEPLLAILDRARQAPAEALHDTDDNSMGFIFAMFLLAQFREPRAYPLLAGLLARTDIRIRQVLGDVMLDVGRLLASVSCGDPSRIQALVEDPRADPKVRAAGLDAMVCLAFTDGLPRQDVVAFFRRLYTGGFERRPSQLWTDLVETTATLGPEELYDEIHRAHDEGLMTGGHVDDAMEMVEDNRVWGLEMGAPQILDTSMHGLVGNTLHEIGSWASFSEESRYVPDWFGHDDDASIGSPFLPELPPESVEPRRAHKIGRNAPCPCGSGKKFKKCCGAPGRPVIG